MPTAGRTTRCDSSRGGTFREAIERFHRPPTASDKRENKEVAFRRLLRSVIDACNAVAYAHSRGVVHRDLKPENIMLGRFGETLVVDWGIAKRVLSPEGETGEKPSEPQPLDDSSMTRPGSVIGTPRYMSPEQAAGDLNRVGPASDVYSLGAILYCVLVGQDAFQDGDSLSVIDRVRRGIFASPRRIRRSIDPVLEAICLKAMSLNPRDRPGSPLDVSNDLETWLADVRYRDEQERALSQVKGSLARLSIERASGCFARGANDEGLLWLARALEDAPTEPPHLDRVIRTSLCGWHVGGKLLERRLRLGGEALAIDFCPEGRRLATASEDRTARLWDVSTGSALSPPLRHDGPVRAVTFRPDGKVIATAGDDGMIRLWDAVTGLSSREPIRCGSPVTSLSFSPDGSRIAAPSGPGEPSLWDSSDGHPLDGLKDRKAVSLAVAFSADGSTLAVACLGGAVHLLDAVTGAALGEALSHDSAIPVVSFDHSGKILLTGGRDGHARVWDLSRRVELVSLGGQGEIRCLAFQPGGSTFATACEEQTARLWNASTGEPVGERLEHRSRVECLAFCPDGSMLATGGQDGTVRLWCSATGLPIGPPLAQAGAVRGMAFSREGGRLATIGPDAKVCCWRVPVPIEADVERLSCWVRIKTNLEFDAGDAIRTMDSPTSWDLRRKLNDLGGAPLR